MYLINGALDAYSPNAFNGILQNTCNMDGDILIFSSEGTPTDALSPAIWNRAMFIDGDIGLTHLHQDGLRAFETKFDFYQELKPDKLKETRKQLKPFAGIISNRALLNYHHLYSARFSLCLTSLISSFSSTHKLLFALRTDILWGVV